MLSLTILNANASVLLKNVRMIQKHPFAVQVEPVPSLEFRGYLQSSSISFCSLRLTLFLLLDYFLLKGEPVSKIIPLISKLFYSV